MLHLGGKAPGLIPEDSVHILGALEPYEYRFLHDADDVPHRLEHLLMRCVASLSLIVDGQLPQFETSGFVVIEHLLTSYERYSNLPARHHRQDRSEPFDRPYSVACAKTGNDLLI